MGALPNVVSSSTRLELQRDRELPTLEAKAQEPCTCAATKGLGPGARNFKPKMQP